MHEWFDAEQRVERAQNFCETRQWSEALAEMDAALTMHPENAAWHAMRGYLLHVLGRESEAADAYEMALQVEPDDRDISMVLGIAMARLGRLARAADVLEELSAKHPDFTPAYCHRIYIYTELGMHERAEEIFYLAQQYDDACPHCFYHMGFPLLLVHRRNGPSIVGSTFWNWSRIIRGSAYALPEAIEPWDTTTRPRSISFTNTAKIRGIPT